MARCAATLNRQACAIAAPALAKSAAVQRPLMKILELAIFAGQPRFCDPKLARLQVTAGISAAWHAALAADPAKSAGAVDGGFAVGIRDANGRAFMAVDPLGLHSLCFRLIDGELHFALSASELSEEGSALDLQATFNYLYFHAIPSPRTIFTGVSRLPPGHFALFENGQLTIRPYFRPRFQAAIRPSFNALKSEFRSLLAESVRRELGTGKPACFLSGGTDSSTVAGMIREVTGEAPATYSIGFEAEGYDEMAYARIAAKHFGTDHHEYYVTPEDLIKGIPLAAKSFDQPFGNSSVLPTFCCAQLAQSDGIKQLLAGDGGDEFFGGNTRYAKQRIFGWYDQVPQWLRGGLLEPLLMHTPLGKLPLARKGASYIEQARQPMPDRLQSYNLLNRLGQSEVLTPGFLALVSAGEPLQLQREAWRLADADTDLDRNLAFDWRFTLAESDLPKVRMATAMAGVEVGYPLLDSALREFSMRLPTDYKLKGLKLRWFFKEALRGFLPDAILTKQKHGFGLPFGVWASRHPGLSALANDSLRSFAQRGLVQPKFIERLLSEHLPAHPGYYGEMVWILMMLEQWLQAHSPDFKLQQ